MNQVHACKTPDGAAWECSILHLDGRRWTGTGASYPEAYAVAFKAYTTATRPKGAA